MKNVFLAAAVERALVERLRADARFRLVDDLGNAHVVITRTTTDVSREFLARAPLLEVVAQGTTGIDNIDAAALEERGIALIHLPGVNANAVAEMVIGLMISLTRTLPAYAREVSRGVWNRDDCAARHELRHYALGVVGYGNVGSRVARLASAFGMRVVVFDPYVAEIGETTRAASLDELLAAAGILTLHVPLTAETRRMIGAEQIAALKSGSFVINAARGEVLDVDAALSALASDHLAGLAIDVFELEPPQRTWPDDPRLILTPHIGGCTAEAKGAAAEMLYERLVRFYAERSEGSPVHVGDHKF